MKWTDFLCATYIINLPKRAQRRMEAIKQIEQYGLPYSVWPAIEKENGADGLRLTMKSIFEVVIKNDFDNIWLLEDDFKFIADINGLMPQILDQLPKDYHLLYLGINAANPFAGLHSENLLKVTRGLSTHSIIYSKEAIKLMVDLCDRPQPIDLSIAECINPLGKCYATKPIFCTQQDGWSDIENRHVSYRVFLEDRFEYQLKALDK